MRILIDNSGYEMKNLGDIAMLQIALSRMREFFPLAELHVLTTNPNRLLRYCPDVVPMPSDVAIEGRSLWIQTWNVFGGLHRLLPRAFGPRLQLLENSLRTTHRRLVASWIVRRFTARGVNTEKMFQYLALVDSADCVVATGGGYLTDAFESHAARVLSLLGLAQHSGLPTFLFGQGLGPLQSPWLQGLCRQVFPKLTFLGLREGKASLPLALSLGTARDRVSVTGDDAIELARSRVPQNLGNDIGVNLRVASYSQVGVELLGRVRDVLHRTSAKLEGQLVPIPISHHVQDSDAATLESLIGPGDENVASLDTPEKVILNVGKCRIVVTGSYHAGVFALSQGIPVIGLAKSPYYQDKFAGLADQFKGGCQVVAMHEQNFPELLESAMEEAWQTAPVTREMLLAQAEAQVRASRQAWEKLKQTMGG